MNRTVNIYCDESCHLVNDGQPVMGFGAVICPVENLATINAALSAMKDKHRARGELKWEKVSPSRLAFYEELIDWFFDEPNVHFRGWLVEHKARLEHAFFNAGNHDDFYYKMYYYLLEPQVRWPEPGEPDQTYRIYLDVKDTRSRFSVKKLSEVLRNKKHDWNGCLVSRLQSVHSRDIHLMQLTDFLLGALTYRNRPVAHSGSAKKACVKRIETRAGFSLTGATPPWEEKFNFFTFTPQEVRT